MAYNPILLIAPGVGSIILSLPYLVSLFGPTESEVRLWGMVALGMGFIAFMMGLIVLDNPTLTVRLSVSAIYFIIIALQVLPILLWWEFHGRGISDGTPASTFMAHWAFSIPHFVLTMLSLLAAYIILHKPNHF